MSDILYDAAAWAAEIYERTVELAARLRWRNVSS